MEANSGVQSAVAGVPSVAPGRLRRTLNLMDLPREILKEILGHCSQSDLICVSLVCSTLREVAASQLYRYFHIVFPDEDDSSFDSPIDGLAGGLETFVTSDYNYAKHLRDLSLDTLSTGAKALKAYKPYQYNVSCGKFMNTLLLLTLRKACNLESFKWNIRVELSRQVYKALHSIKTLAHLQVRMQAGASLYEPPPPLPFVSHASTDAHLPSMTGSVDPLAFSVAQSLQAGPGFNQFYSIFGQNPSVGAQAAFKSAPRKAPRRESGVKEPPTFSGFENLRTLGVLEIDDLEVVPEIHAAVHKSHKTLTKLKLSFSDTLAAKARNPIPITVDIDDIDVDEEFQTTNGPAAAISASHSSVGGAAKSNLVEEERKIQDEVLGQIFGIDRPASRRMQKQWGSDDFSTTDTPKAASLAGNEDDSEARLYLFRDLVNKLAAAFNANDGAEGWQRRLFDLLASATTGPDGGSLGAQFAEEQSGTHDSPASQRVAASEENASQSGAGPAEPDVAAPMAAESEPWGPKWTFKDDTAIESVVDIERPETVELAELLGEDGQDSGPKLVLAAQTPTSTKKVPAIHIEKTLAAQKAKFESMAENLKDLETQANELSERLGTLGLDTDVDSNASTTTTAAVPEDDQSAKGVHQRQQFMDKIEPHAHEVKGLEALVAEYIRTTRPALGLKSLAIHLIPVKASVLSQAVNLRTLKRLTLLNVGPQGPIWDMLAKQNRVAPLALQKIFTDNVTVKFLSCVCELREVKELFMLERSAKETPGSFADPTNITIDDVRRSVLKVHLPHLKRLMIKNDDTTKWDVDERTMAAICKKGKKLEELAVSMGIRTMHVFLQQMSGLANLRALRIIRYRNDDTCQWVLKETRRFIVDNLSHHPAMRLEWISIEDDTSVSRVIRPPSNPRPAGSTEEASTASNGAARKAARAKNRPARTPVLPMPAAFLSQLGIAPADLGTASVKPSWSVDSDDSESDEDEDCLHLELVEGIQFYDVWGVRIFEKEIMAGRL